MSTPYAFAVELPHALPAAIEALRAALTAEQMGIVSEVDVQANAGHYAMYETPVALVTSIEKTLSAASAP